MCGLCNDACTRVWVGGYLRRDGIRVRGHWRKMARR
jgi:hypothetical protein